MTASEEDIIRDQSERSALLRAIADVETTLTISSPGSRRILENSLDGMKLRVATLDKRISEAIKEREVQTQAAAIAMQAQREVRLSESEKQAYSAFLQKDFFAKSDFKSLEQFYGGAWERLSDDGKQEMSHRVWEGIRHGEYRFSELPKIVQEKEAKLAYRELTGPSINADSSLNRMSESDRNEFIQAYRAGDHNRALQALGHDGFRQNMAVEFSTGVTHQAADSEKAANNEAVISRAQQNSPKPTGSVEKAPSAAFADLDLGSVNMTAVKLVDTTSLPQVASIPNASGSQIKTR